MVSVGQAADKDVLTIEGLVAADGSLHRCNKHGSTRVPWCGRSIGPDYAALALCRKFQPTDPDIDQVMSGNLCRCGTYDRPGTVIKRGASAMRETR